MTDEIFVTIAELDAFYGLKPFQIGNVVKLIKGKANDKEAIRVELPYLGAVGVVAERADQVLGGTVSAGRLYGRFSEVCYAQVRFTTPNAVIAQIVKGGHLHIIFAVDDVLDTENVGHGPLN